MHMAGEFMWLSLTHDVQSQFYSHSLIRIHVKKTRGFFLNYYVLFNSVENTQYASNKANGCDSSVVHIYLF